VKRDDEIIFNSANSGDASRVKKSSEDADTGQVRDDVSGSDVKKPKSVVVKNDEKASSAAVDSVSPDDEAVNEGQPNSDNERSQQQGSRLFIRSVSNYCHMY